MSRNLKLILASSLAAAFALAWGISTLRRAQRAEEDRLALADLERVAEKEGLNKVQELLDRRLAKHPRDAMLYYYKARFYYDAGAAAETIREADRAIELGYAQEASHLLKAMAYGRLLQDLRRQRDLASKALSYDPTYEDAYIVRAEAEYLLEDYKACAADAAAYSGLEPRGKEGYETSLLCLEGAQDHAGAEKAGLRLLELDPANHAAFWRLGRIDAARGRHLDAVRKFSKAVELSGGMAEYYLDRARSCSAAGDFVCASTDYESAMSWPEVSREASYYYLLGASLHAAGRLPEARSAADKAVKKDPANPDYLELRGRVLAETGLRAEAARDFRRMAEADPARKGEAESLLGLLKR